MQLRGNALVGRIPATRVWLGARLALWLHDRGAFHFGRTATLGAQTADTHTPGTDLVLTQPRTVGTDRNGIAIVDLMLRATR